jgi:hypothetical protein
MLLRKGAEDWRAVLKDIFATATEQRERPIFRDRRASGDRNIEHFNAARLAESPQLAGRFGRDGAHLDYDATRRGRRNNAIVALVCCSDGRVIRQARDDYVRLHRKRSRARGDPGAMRCQDLHPLRSAIEDYDLEARGDESFSHPRSHRAQANKTDH